MNQSSQTLPNSQPLKIVITGASGNLGREIAKFLKSKGHELLLAGRDQNRLQQVFGSDFKCAGYDDWQDHARGFDVVIDLATRNNDQAGSLDDFRTANVERLKQLVDGMGKANIAKLIYFTTLHADENIRDDYYSLTKREAEKWLRDQDTVSFTAMRLPAVYSATTKGNLRHINALPAFLKPIGLALAKCLRPVVEIDTVFTRLEKLLHSKSDGMREILVSHQQHNNSLYHGISTLMNYTAGILIAVFLSWWLMLAIWIIVRLTSPGPGIFAQERVGKNRKVFLCYKFRTMQVGTVQAGTHEVSTSNITGIGKILRKTKLDELPQFVNLLKNEMSLVGPRPCLPNQHELIEERDKRDVFTIKPGITGLAQVKDIDMSNPEKLARVDRYYLDTRTTLLDIKLMLATLLKRFGKGLHDGLG